MFTRHESISMGVRYKVFGFGRLGGAVFIYQEKEKKKSVV